MKLDTLVLIVVAVLCGAVALVWVAGILVLSFTVPFGFLALIPAALVAYIAYRVLAERVGSAEEDHYDDMEH